MDVVGIPVQAVDGRDWDDLLKGTLTTSPTQPVIASVGVTGVGDDEVVRRPTGRSAVLQDICIDQLQAVFLVDVSQPVSLRNVARKPFINVEDHVGEQFVQGKASIVNNASALVERPR
ncbi:hypothetical protein D3C84_950140 [compost metagenome]